MYFRSPSQTLAHDRSSSQSQQAAGHAAADLCNEDATNGSTANGAVQAAAQ